ncbi:MAG: hypothetical protein C0592_00735 [Marinilabiliales bacterium]|nr:MAG: hypothetical protein C0592_00735 [Marinilabiliales bacterium]
MKTIIISIISAFILAFSGSLKAQKTIIHEPSGVKIIFPVDEAIFPSSWYSGRINGQYEPLDREEYERTEELIISCLQKYPAAMLRNDLEIVYVVKTLEFYGAGYGGTNSNTDVYLTNKGLSRGYDNAYIERVFHAEFSSILLRKYEDYFDEEAWLACNDPEFEYGDGGVAALKSNKSSEDFDEELNKMGFINQYATSDMENDFNSFAKNMFLPRESFLELVKTYPGIKKKSELLIEFYGKIHRFFDKEYFENMEVSEE